MDRRVVGFALALAIAGGCKSDGDEIEEPAEHRSSAPVAPRDAASEPRADARAVARPLELAAADRCASPCLLLAEHRFASVGGAYCEVCKTIKARACELEWPPIEDEPSCDDWDTWRRCLLAAHGYRFKRARYRAEYRRKRWYRPRRGVTPASLGGVARANLEYLETRAASCRKALAARKGRVIARLRGDFDGDRRPELAVVTDSEVRLGKREVDHGLAPSDEMAAIEATLIDIDAGDRAVEILVALHQGEAAPSQYAIVYVAGEPRRKRRGRPGPLSAGPIIETFGTVEATGDGGVEVREQSCGQIKLQVYGYADGELRAVKQSVEGQRDPSRCD